MNEAISGGWELDIRGQIGNLPLAIQFRAGPNPTAIVGKSGAGKTSLFLTILGMLRPENGVVAVDGKKLYCSKSRINLPSEARRVGYLPQKHALFPKMTVLENVRFGLDAVSRHRLSKKARNQRALAMLEELTLEELSHRRPNQLSGGQAQRVALARALVVEPSALLLDEPWASLDPQSRHEARQLVLKKVASRQIPTLIVTHDPKDLPHLEGDVIVIEEGRVAEVSSAVQFANAPCSDFGKAFMEVADNK